MFFAPPCADACAVFRGCARASLRVLATPALRASDCAPPCADACAVFRGCALRFASCARHSSPSGLRCSQAHSRCSLLHWAHRRLLHPQFAMVVLLRPTACSTPASQFSMVASLRSQSSLEMLPASLGSSAAIAPSIRNGRPAAPSGLQYSLAHWAYFGLFSRTARGLRAPTAAPSLSPSLGSSYRPALRWPGIPGLRSASRCSSIQHGRPTALASSLAALPASLGLLRPVSRTARGLRAPLAPPPLRGFDGYGLFPPQAAAFARPSRASPLVFFNELVDDYRAVLRLSIFAPSCAQDFHIFHDCAEAGKRV